MTALTILRAAARNGIPGAADAAAEVERLRTEADNLRLRLAVETAKVNVWRDRAMEAEATIDKANRDARAKIEAARAAAEDARRITRETAERAAKAVAAAEDKARKARNRRTDAERRERIAQAQAREAIAEAETKAMDSSRRQRQASDLLVRERRRTRLCVELPILRAVAKEWGIPTGHILDRRVGAEIVEARYAAMWLMRQRGWSYPQIALSCARNHATVIYGIGRATERIAEDADFRARVERLARMQQAA